MKYLQYLSIFIFLLISSYQVIGQASNPKQNKPAALNISHLTGDFYIYTTYHMYKGQPVPSNSMYMITHEGAVLFDTPWDTTQFQPLLDSIKLRHNKDVVLCIPTHFHDDRTAGLDFLKQKGVKTYSSKQTYDLCKKYDHKQAQFYFTTDTTFRVGSYSFQAYYPGEGHTKDNIVLWFPKEKIIYGGCLVKSIENDDIGNVADANLQAWPTTIQNVIKKYPNPRYVIPGHYNWKSNKALQHTLNLLQSNGKKANP